MLFSGMGVFAEEPEVVGNEDYTVTFRQNPIVDENALVELALLQNGKQFSRGISTYDDSDLIATQTVEIRKYKNHTESDVIVSSISIRDDMLNIMQLQPRASYGPYFDEEQSGAYGVAALTQISYTFTDSGSESFKLNYTKSKILQKDVGNVGITSVFTYATTLGDQKYETKRLTSNASVNVWYTAAWNKTVSVHKYWGGGGAGADYTINGSAFSSLLTFIEPPMIR